MWDLKEQQEVRKASDFFVIPPDDSDMGKMYLFYGDSNSGKTWKACTWFDNSCKDCGFRWATPRTINLTSCPKCDSENVMDRPILLCDFELGRGEKMKNEQFPHKNIEIVEPRVLKEDYNPDVHEDATDIVRTEAEFMDFLVSTYRSVKNGEMIPSSIVIDSGTEVWGIIQEWGFQELVRNHPKYTPAMAKTLRTEIQTDWKIMNNRHFKIIQLLRAVMRYGVDIIWTARYEGPPAYVNDGTYKIRAQKDVPFYSDVRVHLEHRQDKKKNLFRAHVEKLGSYEVPVQTYDRLDWNKLEKIYQEAKDEHDRQVAEEIADEEQQWLEEVKNG